MQHGRFIAGDALEVTAFAGLLGLHVAPLRCAD
jgi:hypothetical protein